MNKKGQLGVGMIIIIVAGILFVLLIWGLQSITSNVLVIKIADGKIIENQLQEKSVIRMNTWGDSTQEGFYDVVISNNGNIIKSANETGAGYQVYYIMEYVDCVDVEILNSETKENLDKKEICKND
jgi:hypothetical protein